MTTASAAGISASLYIKHRKNHCVNKSPIFTRGYSSTLRATFQCFQCLKVFYWPPAYFVFRLTPTHDVTSLVSCFGKQAMSDSCVFFFFDKRGKAREKRFFSSTRKVNQSLVFKATYSHHIHGQCINSVVVLVDQKPSLSIILLLLERTSLEKFLRYYDAVWRKYGSQCKTNQF